MKVNCVFSLDNNWWVGVTKVNNNNIVNSKRLIFVPLLFTSMVFISYKKILCSFFTVLLATAAGSGTLSYEML